MLGARNMVEAALQCGVRHLVHISSIYGFNQFSLDEGRDLSTGAHHSAYGRSKAQGRNELRDDVE